MIVEQARKYKDTPFKHQGRTKAGLDCAGLVAVVCNDLGLNVSDEQGYGRFPYAHTIAKKLNENFEAIPVHAIKPGDILLMSFAGEPQHIAVYAGETIVHSYEGAGGVVEHGYRGKWERRTIAAYRVAL